MERGIFNTSQKGVPQGGNLSPLLSNVMLNELDKELEKQNIKNPAEVFYASLSSDNILYVDKYSDKVDTKKFPVNYENKDIGGNDENN